MNVLLSLLVQILHTGLMVVTAPLAAGAADWLDARLTGRMGPPVLEPWRDLVRLARKTPRAIESVSVVSRVAPAIGLGATLSAASLVPSFSLGMALSPLADVLVLAGLLTTARVAAALAALDSGAARPGLAQQGSSALAVVGEPALMLALFVPALMGGSLNLDSIMAQQQQGVLLPAAASAVALTALLGVFVGEISLGDTGGEEMLGGMDLALSRGSGWLRRLVWIDLIGGLFLPIGIAGAEAGPIAWLTGLAAWAIKLAAFTCVLAFAHALLGRLPRHSLPAVIGVAALLALLATIMVLANAGAA